MKKIILLAAAMLFSSSTFAKTDHYLLLESSHVQHLKITTVGDDVNVSADVDFEPNDTEKGRHGCSADIAGKAKQVNENELILKKQLEGEAKFCSLNIKLTPTGAVIEQSADCSYFTAGSCRFSSEGKELVKVKYIRE